MVVLACTLHDPESLLVGLIEEAPDIDEFYEDKIVVVTDVTSNDTVGALKTRGWKIVTQSERAGLISIGDGRRLALRAGMETGHHTHVNDFDRLLYWATNYPDELRSVVNVIPDHDFLIIGRTQKALDSHPEVQAETEGLVNKVFSLIVGWHADIVVGSRGITREAAELILEHSSAEYCNTDAEWPLIVRHLSDMELGYIEVDGMGYETTMRRRIKVIDDETIPWRDYVNSNPRSWVHRINMAHEIARAAIETHEKYSK